MLTKACAGKTWTVVSILFTTSVCVCIPHYENLRGENAVLSTHGSWYMTSVNSYCRARVGESRCLVLPRLRVTNETLHTNNEQENVMSSS